MFFFYVSLNILTLNIFCIFFYVSLYKCIIFLIILEHRKCSILFHFNQTTPFFRSNANFPHFTFNSSLFCSFFKISFVKYFPYLHMCFIIFATVASAYRRNFTPVNREKFIQNNHLQHLQLI